MARLIVFVTVLIGFILVLTLHSFKSTPVVNDRFDVSKIVKAPHTSTLVSADSTNSDNQATEAPAEVKAEFVVELNTPELENGHKVYAKCVVCHGQSGEGKAAQKAPRIAGQFDWYVEKQLSDMKSGARINDLMTSIVKGLSEQDIKDVSSYVSKFPWK